jgi:hypothetical protein
MVPSKSPAPSSSNFPSIDNQDAVTICVAVIDESTMDNSFMTSQWNTLRTLYPDRPFCLLQPNQPGGPLPTESDLFRPFAFDNDDLATYSSVVRQNRGNPTAISDWYHVCDFNKYKKIGIRRVALFIDNSGSLAPADIALSKTLFQSRLSENGFQEMTGIVENQDEDWIAPCISAASP